MAAVPNYYTKTPAATLAYSANTTVTPLAYYVSASGSHCLPPPGSQAYLLC